MNDKPKYKIKEDTVDRFETTFKLYLLSQNIDPESSEDAVKKKAVATLMMCLEKPEQTKILDKMGDDEIFSKSLKDIFKMLKEITEPAQNALAARFDFNNMKQEKDSVDEFVTRLKAQAQFCRFEEDKTDPVSARIRDQLIFGMTDGYGRTRILMEGWKERTLENVTQLARTAEQAKESAAAMTKETSIGAVSLETTKEKNWNKQEKQSKPCWRCGGEFHRPEVCRYKTETCYNCDKIGHISRMCKKPKQRTNVRTNIKKVTCESSTDESCSDINVINSKTLEDTEVYKIEPVAKTPIRIQVKSNSNIAEMELDTGAGVTVVGVDFWKNVLGHPKLDPVRIKLVSYSGHELKVRGMLNAKVEVHKNSDTAPIIVAEGQGTPLLGRNWLHLINWNEVARTVRVNKLILEGAQEQIEYEAELMKLELFVGEHEVA